MEISSVTAFAALGGAALGGLASFATFGTTVQAQLKAKADQHNKTRAELESVMVHSGVWICCGP